MKIFKSYTYKWWQLGIFKIALLSIGIIIGVYWNEFFASYLTPLMIIWIISALYIFSISLKKI